MKSSEAFHFFFPLFFFFMPASHKTAIRCEAGMPAPALTLQQFKADLYFEMPLSGLQGEKCD